MTKTHEGRERLVNPKIVIVFGLKSVALPSSCTIVIVIVTIFTKDKMIVENLLVFANDHPMCTESQDL